MNTVQGYGSESEDEPVSSHSVASGSRRPLDDVDSDGGEDVVVDSNDVFGLAGLSTNKETGAETHKQASSLVRIAPDVTADTWKTETSLLTRPNDTEMHVNIPYKDMMQPLAGPENPFSSKRLGAQQNNLSGHIEAAAMNDFDFRNQQRTFETLGYARNPSQFAASEYVGDQDKAARLGGASAVEMRNNGGPVGYREMAKELKKKRQKGGGDTGVVEGEGAYLGPWAEWEGEKKELVGPSEEEIRRAEESSTLRQQEEERARERRTRDEERGSEQSTFHGKSMYDYQGRTYMHIPTDTDTNLHGEVGSQQSFLPKACVHTWAGHTKAVSAMRVFPKSGHLLLSGSMDCKIKLWDVYHGGNCLRTFMGHTKAVKDVTFSNDGRRFLSAGYDRQMKLWDTETGQCISAFSHGKVPHVVRFHPDEDKQHTFLAGMSDKKIIQFDTNSGEVTQEYDQHLGPVNTITFVDDNRRLVTTSDDKTMRVWDYDIPVVIKYVADPLMHSMPAVTLHPNKKWLAAQSLDNQIIVYSSDSFRQNRKKGFKGHSVAGYACQVGFSPDGKFISSGDGEGNLVIWDWKSGRLLKRLRAHKQVVIAHEWLPHETSKIITASWDGTMKLWD